MTTYLITGASRGIGHGLVATYLSRPHSKVIAAVRDPNAAAKAFNDLPKGANSNLIIVKIDSTSESDPQEAVTLLQSKHNITSIDTVIANAGISPAKAYGPLASVAIQEVREHVEVNAIGVLVLFQAVLPLLQQSKQPGKFVTVSSPIGSIAGMEKRPYPMTPYGSSKAMLNFFTRKIHFEHEDLITFAVDPGFVQTEMGNAGAEFLGVPGAGTPTVESVAGLVKVVDAATREKTSGHFQVFDGSESSW